MNPPTTRLSKPRLLFCSYHCYLDPSNGAALATRDLLELLSQRGWTCAAFCGPRLDFHQAPSIQDHLSRQHIPFEARPATVGSLSTCVYHFCQNGVRAAIFDTPDPHPDQPPTPEAGQAFLIRLDEALRLFRPDVILTYGGHWLSQRIIARCKEHGLPVVFALHNFAYPKETFGLFRDVDLVIVPSRFAQEHYGKLGLETVAIPGPWNWDRVRCPAVEGRFVTFINPSAEKGLFVIARIAHELWRQRGPDIPLLIVEGRAKADALAGTGLDLSELRNLHYRPNTPDPREFYAFSRLVLMPSVGWESFPRVAVEACINGIPVLASNRGGLPETLAQAPLLLDIPERCKPDTNIVPTAEEVAPWVKEIIALWDNDALYRRHSERCRAAAEAWRPECLLPRWEEALAGVAGRRGP